MKRALWAIDLVAQLVSTSYGLLRPVSVQTAVLLLEFQGTVVTSGYRSGLRNRLVGGVPGSYHTKRRGVDCVPPRADWTSFGQRARALGFIEVIDEGDHWHLAL